MFVPLTADPCCYLHQKRSFQGSFRVFTHETPQPLTHKTPQLLTLAAFHRGGDVADDRRVCCGAVRGAENLCLLDGLCQQPRCPQERLTEAERGENDDDDKDDDAIMGGGYKSNYNAQRSIWKEC